MYQYTCVAFDLEKVDIDGFEAKCGAAQAKPSIEILVSSRATALREHFVPIFYSALAGLCSSLVHVQYI